MFKIGVGCDPVVPLKKTVFVQNTENSLHYHGTFRSVITN